MMEELRHETADLLGIAMHSFERILCNLHTKELLQLRAVSRASNSRVSSYVQHYHRPNLHTVKIEMPDEEKAKSATMFLQNINKDHVFTIRTRDFEEKNFAMRRMALLPLMRIADAENISMQAR
ncbi:hypothetical protein PMAYCL1PPCAC_32116, partial [Pristionchus mayeri]